MINTNHPITEGEPVNQEVVSSSEQSYLHIDCVDNLMRLFQEPLHLMVSLTQLINLNHQLKPEYADALHKLQESAEKLFGLSNQLLDLSQIKSGKMLLSPSPIELISLLTDVINRAQELANNKQIRFSTHIEPSVPNWIVTDGRRLAQIFKKLLRNAIRLTQQGEVSLSVTNIENWLRFEVADTGIGMSDEALLSVFRNHCHIERLQPEGLVSTGLDLSLSKHLIEVLGGEITISSQLGLGTKIVFTLPLIAVEGMESELLNLPCEPCQKTPKSDMTQPLAITPLSGKHVLVVEDNKVNQLVAMRMLQKMGINPVIAANGAEALAMREETHFDLILMDIQMPVKDGYQTVSEIRREEAITGKHQTVIALSVNGLQADFYTATEMGMDDYITKPIDFKLLEERLSYWLLRN